MPEMTIPRLATVKGEEKREICIVSIEEIQGTQVEDVVAGNRREKGVQKVVFFFVELGIVDAENFVEVGARPIHFGQVEVVNNNGQRKVAKVIPVQLNLLDPFAEFPDLALFGIIKQYILRSPVVHVDLADERTLGVVKMAAFGLDDPSHLAGIFLFPFRDDVIVRFHFEEAFEDEWEALGGGFLEGQDLDVVVVHAQIPAVAFERRFGQIVVEEGVVFQLGEFEFVGMKVERSLENAEGSLRVRTLT